MWQEWLERTLSHGSAPAEATAKLRLFDAVPEALPVPANANPDPAPPPMSRADAGECVDA